MGSNLFLGFLLGLGAGAWVYSKMMKSTGNNIKNSLIVAVVAGVFAMFLLATILGSVVKK